jgi:hypothetical protein
VPTGMIRLRSAAPMAALKTLSDAVIATV